MMGIKLKYHYRMQLASKNFVSLFNTQNQNKQVKVNIEAKDGEEFESEEKEDDLNDLCMLNENSKKTPKLMIKADKRRFQQVLINI